MNNQKEIHILFLQSRDGIDQYYSDLRERTAGMENLLTRNNFLCTSAFVEEGVSHAREGNYDLIILELKLHDFDGRDCLLKLREAQIKTPILILGEPMENYLDYQELKVQVLAFSDYPLRCDEYLTSPYEDELRNKIRDMVHKHRSN